MDELTKTGPSDIPYSNRQRKNGAFLGTETHLDRRLHNAIFLAHRHIESNAQLLPVTCMDTGSSQTAPDETTDPLSHVFSLSNAGGDGYRLLKRGV